MYFLAGHRNYSFVLTKASAVDKCNKAGDVYGKMLVLTFEDNEDAMMNRILSLINTKEEVIQMSGMNEHLLNFKGLMIDEVQRVIIRENQEIELTYTEFEILKLLARDDSQSINPSINPSVPEQKSEVQTALEILQKQRTEMVVRPIFPYVQRFKDKRLLGNVELLAKLLDTNHLETWEDVRAFEEKQTEVLENCRAELAELSVRYEKWTQAVSDYDDYKKYQPVMKEYQALSGLRKNSFKKKHETELENYAIYRDRVKAVMPENMKISKPYIDKQLAEVLAQQEQIQRNSSRVATDLARLSVFKGNLREMEAQQRADEQAREQNRDKKHENTI